MRKIKNIATGEKSPINNMVSLTKTMIDRRKLDISIRKV